MESIEVAIPRIDVYRQDAGQGIGFYRRRRCKAAGRTRPLWNETQKSLPNDLARREIEGVEHAVVEPDIHTAPNDSRSGKHLWRRLPSHSRRRRLEVPNPV